MADSCHLSVPTPAPLYVYITDSMQALYTRRGMWLNGQPQGVLAGMLGAELILHGNKYRKAYCVSADQLAELWLDIQRIPADAVGGHQIAQFGRRLREAAARGGLDFAAILHAKQTGAPLAAAQLCIAAAAPIPFHPLERPSHGKAAILFQEHVMRTVREFVDFTQSTEYLEGACRA